MRNFDEIAIERTQLSSERSKLLREIHKLDAELDSIPSTTVAGNQQYNEICRHRNSLANDANAMREWLIALDEEWNQRIDLEMELV